MSSINDQLICSCDENANCIECSLNEKLFCKYNRKKWLSFVWVLILLIILEFLGSLTFGLLKSKWWPVISFTAVAITFFLLGIKSFILCRHCPFYAEEGKVLHCLANTGMPKIWKYQPEPLNLAEKIFLLIFFSFIFLWGIGWEIYSLYFIITERKLVPMIFLIILLVSNLAIVILFIIKLQKQYCPFCPNFSCPMNKVAKEIVLEYLKKNPTIEEAWKKRGLDLETKKLMRKRNV